MIKQNIRVFICIALVTGACRDADDAPMRTHDFQAPIVTGLFVTNNFTVLETWLNPSRQGNIFALPSITGTATNIRVAIPQTGKWVTWITSASMEGDDLLNSFGGAQNANIPGVAIRTFAEQSYPSGALIYISWDLKDDQGNKVRPGFYRVFVETDEDVLYTDMFVYYDCSDIPNGIKTEICN